MKVMDPVPLIVKDPVFKDSKPSRDNVGDCTLNVEVEELESSYPLLLATLSSRRRLDVAVEMTLKLKGKALSSLPEYVDVFSTI